MAINTNRMIVAGSWKDVPAGQIVRELHSKYLAPDVKLGDVQDGPTLSEAMFNYELVSHALGTLAKHAGFTWEISEDNVLDFRAIEG